MLDACVIWATSHEVGQAVTLTTSFWLSLFRCYILQNRGDRVCHSHKNVRTTTKILTLKDNHQSSNITYVITIIHICMFMTCI